MRNPIGQECDQLIKASYQASMYTDKDGFTFHPPRQFCIACRVLKRFPDPVDCRQCNRHSIRENYIKEMTIDA